MQELIDAINRLRNAAAGDKKQHANWIDGFAASAIAGALGGATNWPRKSQEDIEAGEGLDEYADEMELFLDGIEA